MKRLMMIAALCAAATLAQAETKKELVQKVLLLQQPMIENIARSWLQTDRPAAEAWLAKINLPDDRKQLLLNQR